MTIRSQTPEGRIEAKIVAWLSSQPGTLAVPYHVSPLVRGGRPDLFVCRQGRFIGLEVKRAPDIDCTLTQRITGGLIQAAGGQWHVVASVDHVKALYELSPWEPQDPQGHVAQCQWCRLPRG